MNRLAFAFALVALVGCSFERHAVVSPGANQVIRVESGDRFFFELEENATTGYRWECKCDDCDVDVLIDHRSGAYDGDGRVGVGGEAKVTVRVHRGYDGPSTLKFAYRRPWEKKPAKQFTITLFKRTGDCAFWE